MVGRWRSVRQGETSVDPVSQLVALADLTIAKYRARALAILDEHGVGPRAASRQSVMSEP